MTFGPETKAILDAMNLQTQHLNKIYEQLAKVDTKDVVVPSVWEPDSINNPVSDRTLKTTRHPVGIDGTLTTMQIVIVTGTPARNLYTRCYLEDQNKVIKGTLFRGYSEVGKECHGQGGLVVRAGDYIRLDTRTSITTTVSLRGTILPDLIAPAGWRGTDEGNLDGQGAIRVIQGTQPPAATVATANGTTPQISEAVPNGAKWKLLTVNITLTCSATASTREPSLLLTDTNNNQYFKLWSSLTITASGAGRINAHIGTQKISASQSGNSNTLPLGDFVMDSKHMWKTVSAGLQMGDQYDQPIYLVEEWLKETT